MQDPEAMRRLWNELYGSGQPPKRSKEEEKIRLAKLLRHHRDPLL
jgi:hypothetical protein